MAETLEHKKMDSNDSRETDESSEQESTNSDSSSRADESYEPESANSDSSSGTDESSEQENTDPAGGSEAKVNRCDQCGRIYVHRCHLLQHLRSHAKETRAAFKCAYCPMAFHRNDVMRRHVNRCHTGTGGHVCKKCGKRFFDAYDLQRHDAVHSKARAFACLVCAQRFSQKCTLTAHARLHNGPLGSAGNGRKGHFPCPECGSVFTRHHTLMRHCKAHSDSAEISKPFRCKFCSARFTRLLNLKLHRTKCRKLFSH